MATNTNLGGVFTTDIDSKKTSNVFLSTENVVGLIFDTSIVGGLDKALGTDTVAAKAFANGNVVELNTSKDLKEAGIDESVLAGVAKYHLDCFFSLAGGTQRIFVSFMNSDEDTEFESVEKCNWHPVVLFIRLEYGLESLLQPKTMMILIRLRRAIFALNLNLLLKSWVERSASPTMKVMLH